MKGLGRLRCRDFEGAGRLEQCLGGEGFRNYDTLYTYMCVYIYI